MLVVGKPTEPVFFVYIVMLHNIYILFMKMMWYLTTMYTWLYPEKKIVKISVDNGIFVKHCTWAMCPHSTVAAFDLNGRVLSFQYRIQIKENRRFSIPEPFNCICLSHHNSCNQLLVLPGTMDMTAVWMRGRGKNWEWSHWITNETLELISHVNCTFWVIWRYIEWILFLRHINFPLRCASRELP